MNYKLVGSLRSLGVVVIIAVLAWAQQATNLEFIGNPIFVSLIVAVAGAIEHNIEETKGRALFGGVRV